MLHLYFYKSTKKCDNLSQLTIVSNSARKAYVLALKNFIQNGYQGVPVRLAL